MCEVIDGQQRLSALTLVALALIRQLEDWADARVDATDNRQRAERYLERACEHFASVRNGKVSAEFMETLARRLVFIAVVVDDEAAAHTVFETLNARGVALGEAGLVKNFLFSRAAAGGTPDSEELERQWDSLTELVCPDQLAERLHHQANTQAPNSSKRDVCRRIRDSIKSPGDALVRELTRTASSSLCSTTATRLELICAPCSGAVELAPP